MPKNSADLSPKEQVFVREYLLHGNATKAAVAAGYSAATASVTGSKLLRKAKVSAELAKLREKLLAKLEISSEKVLQGIAELAFFDIRKFFSPRYAADVCSICAAAEAGHEVANHKFRAVTMGGDLIPVDELDEQTARALKGCDVEKLFKHFGKGQAEESGTITKIRVADRLEALALLGRHLKLFTDKIEVTDAQAIVQKLQQGRARVAAMKIA